LNSSKEKRITPSTFLSKGCLPIPQLFGARNLFLVGKPLQEKDPPVCDRCLWLSEEVGRDESPAELLVQNLVYEGDFDHT
jgi:hypothetical protein